jgi:hypothetical protein
MGTYIMPLTAIQIGRIAENELAKLLLMGSDGRLAIFWPMTDEERRDAEVHVRGKFGVSLALQVKSATHLQRHPRSSLFQISFTVPANRLISDPWFWYYIPLLSMSNMGVVDPQYLVNSTKLHEHAAPTLRGGVYRFRFQANTAVNSHDMWVPDRVNALDVGRRVLQIIDDLEKLPKAQRPAGEFHLPPGVAVVRRKG